MRSWLAVVLALVSAAPVVLLSAAAPAQDRRIALVVGNARYAEAPLRNPVNDARAMAAALRERGFEVLLREDGTKTQMEAAIIDFGEKLNQGATGLFYYSGHGMQVNGRNYLIPIDAKLTSEQRLKLETLDLDVVLDQMQGARSKVNMVILDACRNNPFERRFRSFSGGLAQINAPEGTLIAYATAPGKVAADGHGANGLYTSELLKALRAPGLKVEDVFKQVRINVSRVSGGNQTPWEASSLIGDFYFVPPPPPAPPSVVAAPRPSEETIELAFWESVKATSSASELETYLRQYPNGRFAALARTRLAGLNAPPPAPTPPAPFQPSEESLELTYWESVKGSNVIPELEAYLAQYPKGRFATLARARVAALKAPRVPAIVAPQNSALSGNRSFDGKYQAVLRGASWTVREISAELEINGAQISGRATRDIEHRGCRISGHIGDDGVLQKSLRIDCERLADRDTKWDSLVIEIDGRFARTPDGQDVVGETTFKSSDGRTGSVQWRRASAAGQAVRPAVAVVPATPPSPAPTVQQASLPSAAVPVNGRYTGSLRNTHPLSTVLIDASFDLRDREIRGSAYMHPDGRVCSLSGSVDRDGTAVFTVGCEASEFAYSTVKNTHSVTVTGRFVKSASGATVVESIFRSNNGRSGPVTWERQD